VNCVLRFLLAGFAVAGSLRDASSHVDLGQVRLGHLLDVAGRVPDPGDLEGVDLETHHLHVGAGGVEHLGGEGLALADQLLDRERPDDASDVAREDFVDPVLHRVGIVQEPLGGVGDGDVVRPHLESDDAFDLHWDPLGGGALDGHQRVVQVERQVASPLQNRDHEDPIARGHDLVLLGLC
jgi:hypothetical protein